MLTPLQAAIANVIGAVVAVAAAAVAPALAPAGETNASPTAPAAVAPAKRAYAMPNLMPNPLH